MSRKILITGASRGLGRFLTQKYLEDGNTVFAGVRDLGAEYISELMKTYGERLIPVVVEVTDTDSVKKAAVEVKKFTNKLDILINNAAIHCDTSFMPIEETNLDDCLEVYDVNAVGPLRVIKAFLPMLTEGSKIVNISSESGSIGMTGRNKEFDYCMSKAALNMGSKLIQNYVKDKGIKVLAIQPGWMRTDMGGSSADLDPYETAVKLANLFDKFNDLSDPIFIDNEGNELPW